MVTQHKSVSLNSMQELVRPYHVSKPLSFSILPHSYGPDGEAGGDLFLAGLRQQNLHQIILMSV